MKKAVILVLVVAAILGVVQYARNKTSEPPWTLTKNEWQRAKSYLILCRAGDVEHSASELDALLYKSERELYGREELLHRLGTHNEEVESFLEKDAVRKGCIILERLRRPGLVPDSNDIDELNKLGQDLVHNEGRDWLKLVGTNDKEIAGFRDCIYRNEAREIADECYAGNYQRLDELVEMVKNGQAKLNDVCLDSSSLTKYKREEAIQSAKFSLDCWREDPTRGEFDIIKYWMKVGGLTFKDIGTSEREIRQLERSYTLYLLKASNT